MTKLSARKRATDENLTLSLKPVAREYLDNFPGPALFVSRSSSLASSGPRDRVFQEGVANRERVCMRGPYDLWPS